MAMTWLSNLFGGNSNPYRGGGSVLSQGTSLASAQKNIQKTTQTRNAYADRMTAMARYYRGANARGVAQVRAVDNMQPKLTQNRDYLNRQTSNYATTNRYQGQYDAYQQYLTNARRGFDASGQRLTGQAADWMAQNAFTFQQPQPQNQYGYGGGGGYGYDSGYGGGSGASMPDWYNNFLGQMNWRI